MANDCPLDQQAQYRLQIELLFALMNRVDPLDAVQTFVDAISGLIPPIELELEFVDQSLESEDTAVRIPLSGNGVLSLAAKGANLPNVRPWLIKIAQFIDKALGTAHGFASASAVVTSTSAPASMIARDLHDGVAQELAYLSLQMGLLVRKIRQPEKARPLAEELRAGLSRLQRRVRELISHARLSLSGKSLRQSLSELVHELSPRSDIVFNLDNRLPDGLLGAEVELQLMHIVREALVNAIRHSRAKTVSIELRANSPAMCSSRSRMTAWVCRRACKVPDTTASPSWKSALPRLALTSQSPSGRKAGHASVCSFQSPLTQKKLAIEPDINCTHR